MSAPFTVEISSAARRQLHQLPDKIAMAVVEFVTAVLLLNPLRLSNPLTGPLSGLRSARRGDYRVLIEFDENSNRVLVVRIAHRAQAYRPPASD